MLLEGPAGCHCRPHADVGIANQRGLSSPAWSRNGKKFKYHDLFSSPHDHARRYTRRLTDKTGQLLAHQLKLKWMGCLLLQPVFSVNWGLCSST